jgi:hypothetical protein
MAQLQGVKPSARRWSTFRIPRAVLAYARSSVTAHARIQRAAFNANRAFIQFAGFTIGTAQSFFDFYSSPARIFSPRAAPQRSPEIFARRKS